MANDRENAHHPLSFLALADPLRRPDRAAPLARRLAAGVGSRVALPRGAAQRVGQTQLANQTGFVMAQHECILGCALFAATKIGGRYVSRLALWRADASEASRFHLDCRFH